MSDEAEEVDHWPEYASLIEILAMNGWTVVVAKAERPGHFYVSAGQPDDHNFLLEVGTKGDKLHGALSNPAAHGGPPSRVLQRLDDLIKLSIQTGDELERIWRELRTTPKA
ncbi:hypothetical protein AB0G15_05270 [Streptosporangium sp. NPDC023825]|uniref:hypothetical protein n=1 Tax=Streptosporangium sp. NPDC023825 TaxID=3154909 RepID=UPI003416A09C